MVRRLALTLLLGFSLAQGTKPLLVGERTLEAVYPLGRGVSYAEARPFARALGLAYKETETDLYLGLGARAIRLPIAARAKDALANLKAPLALREEGRVLIPLRRVAEALGARYTGSEAAIRVELPPAYLKGQLLARGEEGEQLFLRFSRDVNALELSPGRLLVLGGAGEVGYLPVAGERILGIEVARHPLGLELYLLGAEGEPFAFAPAPGGIVVWVGPRPRSEPPPRVVVDGGEGAFAQRVARALVRRLAAAGVKATLGGGKTPEARAEAGARADVFLVLSERGNGGVYTYRPRGRELELRFLARAREALLLGNAPKVLAREVALPEASTRLAELVARRLGVPRRSAEVALLAWAPKAAVLVELPRGDAERLAARLGEAVLDYLGRTP